MSRRIISGKTANLVWNRIGEELAKEGIANPDISYNITVRLIDDGLIEGAATEVESLHADTRIRFVKLHDDAVAPKFAHATDAGADLVAVGQHIVPARGRATIPTGIAVELPKGKVGLVHPRSGLASKKGITVLNTPGTIDSGYRGELMVILYNTTDEDFVVEQGERIAQFVVQNYDYVDFVEATELSDADRGTNGFGSTGTK